MTDAILKGGPFDGTQYGEAEDGLLELESDGLIHRYIPTTQTQEAEGKQLAVFQFDGSIAPDGGMPGAENPKNRLASPLAKEMEAEHP